MHIWNISFRCVVHVHIVYGPICRRWRSRDRSISDPTAACPLYHNTTFEFLSQQTAELCDSQHPTTEIKRNTLWARHKLLQYVTLGVYDGGEGMWLVFLWVVTSC